MYGLSIRGCRWLPSRTIAARLTEADPGCANPDTMRHLVAIEELEARGMNYSNQDFDVLNAAWCYLSQVEAAAIRADGLRKLTEASR